MEENVASYHRLDTLKEESSFNPLNRFFSAGDSFVLTLRCQQRE